MAATTTRDVPAASHRKLCSKILIKATSKTSKKASTFTLRNISTSNCNSPEKLKIVIREQLQKEKHSSFDIGYYQGLTVISIRSVEDLTDVWDDVCLGTKVTLWCNGLKENKKGKKRAKSVNPNDSESSTEDELPIKSRKKNTEVRY